MIKNIFLVVLSLNAIAIVGLLLAVFVRRLARAWQAGRSVAGAKSGPRFLFGKGERSARPVLQTLKKV